ncbi:ABC transporter permease [Paenibacillus motobuensis]|uniref:ABC transporter permease n=1 Tax=Paenibacillus TaxID=44249 RepID=UPI0020425BA5|nr:MULTISPECIES: ABC transporter permease [Paenibacillus]MCM3040084.1 ABC transporter permease [Paenibacillus lutimineralis]MCM3647188.1 ABC transporter permease [Paenibacillus motobuensis]
MSRKRIPVKIRSRIISKKSQKAWGLLKLVRCEFTKLKRKKFVLLVILAAFLFPIPFTMLAMNGDFRGLNVYDKLFGIDS